MEEERKEIKAGTELDEEQLLEHIQKLGPDVIERLYQDLVKRDPDRKPTTDAIGFDPTEDRTYRTYSYEPARESPRLSNFSGIKDRDSSFGRWRFEVKCLQRMYPEHQVMAAINRSLKSPAADVMIHTDGQGLQGLLKKMESLYGSVMSGDALMTKVYSEPQRQNEDCAQWATRLEDLCYQAVEKGAVGRQEVSAMISSRFWAGLKNSNIKNALRSSKQQMSTEELVAAARELEEEFGDKTAKDKKSGVQLHQQQEEPSQADQIKQLNKRLDELMATVGKPAITTQHTVAKTNTKATTVKCHRCEEDGHFSYGCRQGTDITCYKCNKVGHISRACRTSLN